MNEPSKEATDVVNQWRQIGWVMMATMLKIPEDDWKELAIAIDAHTASIRAKLEHEINVLKVRIESLEADYAMVRKQRDEGNQRAGKAERERDHWKANHDNQVNLRRALMDRPDLKERAELVHELIECVRKLERERDHYMKIAVSSKRESFAEYSKRILNVSDETAALKEENAKLREALRPFAKLWDHYESGCADAGGNPTDSGMLHVHDHIILNVGDLRRASEALKEGK